MSTRPHSTHNQTSSWIKPVCLCVQSSFVVRQNSWADVVAVVITLGLTGSRWLSSYKARVKAEGKHRHQNNKKLSHRNVVTQRSIRTETERERESVGGNHSHHNAKLLKRLTESEWKLQKRRKTKPLRIVSGITDDTCCFYAASQLFEAVLQAQLCMADVPLSVNRI